MFRTVTVAISCNLSDGVILGVDSAVTVAAGGDHVKIWENAEKLFQIADRPIGAAIYGLAGFGDRSIGSYLREFELSNPNGVLTAQNDLASVVEAIRLFLHDKYHATIVPAIQAAGQDFDQALQNGTAPALGLAIGGYSSGEYLPELWHILIPYNAGPNSALQRLDRGQLGTSWYSLYEPIVRYINGYDQQMFTELKSYMAGLLGRVFTPDEETQINGIVNKYQYTVSFGSMPIAQGVEYVRFLVNLAIKHFHFSSGFAHAPFTEKVVGGRARLGVVTYKGGTFKILDEVES
jgi:hypothetical protein